MENQNNPSKMFDIERAAKRSGLSAKKIKKIKGEVKKEFPNDRMMYELHVIRALHTYGGK